MRGRLSSLISRDLWRYVNDGFDDAASSITSVNIRISSARSVKNGIKITLGM